MPAMHEVDYEIVGDDMQFVKIELDPGEAVISEAGSMMYIEDGIEMQTIFGDGSQQQQGGFMGALLSAGKRVIVGESLFMTVFLNQGQGKRKAAFAAPYPGRIQAIRLADIGGELIAQKDSFLCAAKGVSLDIAFTKRFGAGLFGGEGFILQRLKGDGWCFVHAGGAHEERTLAAGETLRVDTGCIVAMQPGDPASSTTSSWWAASRPRSSAARACSSPPCAGRARSGSSRCPSAAWRAASTPPRRRPAGRARGGLDPRRAGEPAERRPGELGGR